ncbi:MAG: hypothetical protein COV48_11770 [Elusimicrobia bacterium CG11_big_fil_rev_8_21_14_0_20_64_6]|nr:MAG: hypothetical protein COV48_11770 [Elusimicrobia bacterium CG11_big_fil_rev_8_21_14_0_20_64_6]
MIAAILLAGTALAASAAGLQPSWVLPPSAEATAADAVLAGVDPSGAAWLVLDGRIIAAPEGNVVLLADRAIQQLAWIGSKPVVRSFEALGTFVPGAPDAKGPPEARFKPITTVPLTSWRMAPAGAEDVYVAGYNPRKRLSQIAVVGSSAGSKPLRVLYETPAQIADVAGDGTTSYFASGPAIWKVDAEGSASVYSSHARPVRSIAAAPGGGLFFVTDTVVGYAGKSAPFNLLRCSRCRISVRDDDLYVLFNGPRGGLLRVRGVRSLAEAGW